MDPGAGSSSPPPMDSGLGGAGRTGSGGGGGGGGGGRDSPFVLGGGGASAAAWTRLVSSGVEDELVAASGGGGVRAGARAGGLPQGHFLEACFLCRKPLASNRDIFMYRFAPSAAAVAIPTWPCVVPLVLLLRLLGGMVLEFCRGSRGMDVSDVFGRCIFLWKNRKFDCRIVCRKSGSRTYYFSDFSFPSALY